MHLGDAQNILRKEVDVDLPQEDTVLLKEPGLYCFLLHCKKPKAKLFIEWVMETVLPRQVQKLASVIEEKVAALALFTDDLQALELTNEAHQQKILRINKEINDLIANRHIAHRGCFDVLFHQKEQQISSPILCYSMPVQAA